MIAIIDYGLGNVKAFANVYNKLNIEAKIVNQKDVLLKAKKIILPGVGAFDYAMDRLNQSGLRDTLEDLVLNKEIPLLGICVGMQMLARASEEGNYPGLGWVDGEVIKFKIQDFSDKEKIPHMGWNDVQPVQKAKLMQDLYEDARFYFLHSYYFSCNNSSNSLAVANYGTQFTCAIGAKNIFGVQFHPEKSHGWGVQLLKNFSEL